MAYLNQCEYKETFENGHEYTFSGPCVVTGKPYSVTVKGPDLFRYHRGEYIQNAFPYLSPDDREFLMTGISPEGWKETFREEEN